MIEPGRLPHNDKYSPDFVIFFCGYYLKMDKKRKTSKNLRDPCLGQASQILPQAAPIEQQQTIRDCGCDMALVHCPLA